MTALLLIHTMVYLPLRSLDRCRLSAAIGAVRFLSSIYCVGGQIPDGDEFKYLAVLPSRAHSPRPPFRLAQCLALFGFPGANPGPQASVDYV